jgi:hypothetical protein
MSARIVVTAAALSLAAAPAPAQSTRATSTTSPTVRPADPGDVAGLVCLGAVGLGVFFLPTLIALLRNHPSGVSILVVNLFLGPCVVGWVIALAWAFADTRRR